MTRLFETIYETIDARLNTNTAEKADVKADVQEIQAEVANGDQANEDFLARRLRNIGAHGPDVLEAMVDTFASPMRGMAAVVRKVIAKVKQELSE